MRTYHLCLLSFLILLIGNGAVYTILIGGQYMNTSALVTIISSAITVIGTVVGSVLIVYFPLRRDGKTIDSISGDTKEMLPVAHSVDKNAEMTKATLTENVVPAIQSIQNRNQSIDMIVSEINYHRRLQSEASANAGNQDLLHAAINSVFAENARLNQKLLETQKQYDALLLENIQLKAQHQLDKNLIHELKNKCNHYGEPASHTDYEPEI